MCSSRSSHNRVLIWLAVLLVPMPALLAQTPEATKPGMERFQIIPAVVPSSSPETGLKVSGAALMKIRPVGQDTVSYPTTVITFAEVSTRGGLSFGMRSNSSFLLDRLRLETDLSFQSFPDHYWGLGFDRASTIPKGDSTTAYDRKGWLIRPTLLVRVFSDLFAGAIVDLNYTNARNPNPVMRADPDFLRFGPKNFNSGGGIIVRFDSRDLPVNAFSGGFLQIIQSFYGSLLGGDNTYRLFDIDYRGYRQVGRPGSTLAWTARVRKVSDLAPYAEVSQIGSARDLRGYLQGQYRDRGMLYAIVEYRHMLRHFWSDAKTNKFGEPFSRHGFAVWGGIGTIGRDANDEIRLLPNIGLGYRFEALKRVNVRVDFGFGREGMGFYLDFEEAF